jgi:hypothetical protein
MVRILPRSYSPIIAPFEALWPGILTTSLNQQQTITLWRVRWYCSVVLNLFSASCCYLTNDEILCTAKLSLCLTNYALHYEGVWESGCIDPHFLDIGTSWRWVVSFTSRPLYPREKSPKYPLDRRLGGLQSWSGRRGEEKILDPYRDSKSDPSVAQPVASRNTDCTINFVYGRFIKISTLIGQISFYD